MAIRKQQRLVEDRLWELIEPLLPPPQVARGPGGRPRIDERAALDGIRGVLRAGVRFGDALKIALTADTVAIAVMEIVDNAMLLVVPGAMGACGVPELGQRC